MLADDDAPSHAASLVEVLSYARAYGEDLSELLEAGQPDPEEAHRLVQAMRNMLCAAEDELDHLDDVQTFLDTAKALRALTDPGPIIDTPTPGNP
ncbi:hypothetical protein [Streptomyces pseudogriseolus]|uniref:hypothetical protein n=1 Tax=Streptomyces pseudogriseolus TaxID=36817 RepID=UPI00348688A6